MKKLKWILLCIVFTGFTSHINAQKNEMSEEQMAERRQMAEAGLERLQLTEEQKPNFMAIHKKYAEKIKAINESSSSRMSKMFDMKSLISAKNKEVKPILSKEQYKVYLQMQEERKNKMRENRGNR